MSLFKINEVELEIDMEDADFQDKYQTAFDKMAETEKKLVKAGRAADITRAYCHMYFDLFDDIFGDGTADKIFNGKCKTSVCEEVYMQFIGECSRQVSAMMKHRDAFVKKFTPNRAARRDKKSSL